LKYLRFILLYVVSFFIRPFFKIDKKLLLFGVRGGTGFDDNTKYLFLYGSNYKDYNCVWISKDKNIIKRIRKMGYKSEYYFSLNALKLGLKANAIFITHSLSDVMPIFYNKKTQVYNLYHGIPMKKIEFLDKNIPLRGRLMNHWKSKRTTYFATNSSYYTEIYKKSFRLPSNKILKSGYPRMEFLIDPDKFKVKLENPFKLGESFLYLPTFRDYESHIILEDGLLNKINQIMKDNNSNFYIKLHPFEKRKIDVSHYSNIFLLSNKHNTQEILPFADVLITDYSSVVFDFLIFDKPVIFYCHDLDKYLETRGFLIDFEGLFKTNIAKNPEEFILKLQTYKEQVIPENIKNKIVEFDMDNCSEVIFNSIKN